MPKAAGDGARCVPASPGAWVPRVPAAPLMPAHFLQLVAYEVKRMHADKGNKQKILRHIKELAEKLYKNVSAAGRGSGHCGGKGSPR